MKNRRTIISAAAAVLALAATGAGVAVATQANDDDSEPAITGEALQRASEAALAHTGGGRVTETEQGDEESYYEVEVTMDDGRQIDVQLDRDFTVVGDEVDTGEDDDGADDD